jgi:hypothetical protein
METPPYGCMQYCRVAFYESRCVNTKMFPERDTMA